MEKKRTPQIDPRRDRELREYYDALARGETPPPLKPATKPAATEIEPEHRARGREGFGHGKLGDNLPEPGANEGFGRRRFRG